MDITASETTEASEESLQEGDATPEVNSEESAEEGTESTSNESFSSVDPKELPPELQERYKQMQADYTRKAQEIGEIRNKAQLYDQMQQEQLLKEKFPEPEQVNASDESLDYVAESLGIDLSTADPEYKASIANLAKMVDAIASKRIQEQVGPMQRNLLERDYKQELADVKTRYPDFDEYRSAIVDTVKNNPQMSFEQAYKLASYEDREKKGRTEAMKNLEVKKQISSPRSASSAKEEENLKSFEDIYNWAKGQTK